jgi:hypothetical protein
VESVDGDGTAQLPIELVGLFIFPIAKCATVKVAVNGRLRAHVSNQQA